MSPTRTPSATYRLQLSPAFDLDQAAALVPYLNRLGISHVYLSPPLQAAPGSSGYGLVDPNRVDAALGGEAAWLRLVIALQAAGMGVVLDIVPNHMAADPANPWWRDLEERGRASAWAGHFDVWWEESRPGQLRYRRFFDVNSLVGVRQEHSRVFADTHGRILEWVSSGDVHGLRVDHPDGLRDPEAYLWRLRLAAPGTWLLAEKILSPGEGLPPSWPVAGTTGYDFMNLALGLFVDPAAEAPLTRLYHDISGDDADFADVAHDARVEVLGTILKPEVDHLVRVAGREDQPAFRPALVEYLACLPVYRTYLRPGGRARPADQEFMAGALAEARRRRPDLDPDLLAVAAGPELAPDLQQLSGGAMAKGVEDTAFYRYNRFVALNEVGGDPSRFGVSVAQFHEWCGRMALDWPGRMNATATHDTKRGEDVRARLAVLTEMPEAWADAVADWQERIGPSPDPGLEYHLFQVLTAAHPLSEERALAYMLKAAREAKRGTSWIEPDAAFETGLAARVRRALPLAAGFADRLLEPGWRNSLALKLLCLTAPGVPDVYQGGELWDLSLVDPDNRRAIDFGLRARLLDDIEALDAGQAWAQAGSGLAKLFLVRRVLGLRRRRSDLFGPGAAYEPIPLRGPESGHALAYLRGGGAVSLVSRFSLSLARGWCDTSLQLPAGSWRDHLSGQLVDGGWQPLSALLGAFPVALLVGEA